MGILMTANLVLAASAFALALSVGLLYLRTHRQVPSPFTLALAAFAAFFVLHNGLLVYHYVVMMGSFGATAERFLFVEGVLQVSALGALLYAVTR